MPTAVPNARDWGRLSQQSLVVIAIVLVIGALHLARSAVVPILFAVFLAMLLSPAVALVHRVGVPRAIAAGIVVISLVTVVGLGLNATWRPARDWLDAVSPIRTLERKLRPVTRFIAKVESVSEQAERVTDPGATKSGTQAPATTADKKSTIANTQEWVIAILTTLMVTYFLLAAGPSLLVKIESTQASREPNHSTAARGDGDQRRPEPVLRHGDLDQPDARHRDDRDDGLAWHAQSVALGCRRVRGQLRSLRGLGRDAGVAHRRRRGVARRAGQGARRGGLLSRAATTVEGQVVQPILVGRRLDVSPLVVFLSLWFGGWLWGIAGVALAVPLLVAAKALRLELRASEPTAAALPGGRESTVRSRAAELLAVRCRTNADIWRRSY